MENLDVIIEPGSRTATDVLDDLNNAGVVGFDIRVDAPRATLQFRAVDVAVLVASIGAVGSTLTALVAGLLQISAARKGQRISIELASGNKIDVPVGVTPEDLERTIASLSEPPARIILP